MKSGPFQNRLGNAAPFIPILSYSAHFDSSQDDDRFQKCLLENKPIAISS